MFHVREAAGFSEHVARIDTIKGQTGEVSQTTDRQTDKRGIDKLPY